MGAEDQHREIHGQSWLEAEEEGDRGSGEEVEAIAPVSPNLGANSVCICL
jgi:hypothetical protein